MELEVEQRYDKLMFRGSILASLNNQFCTVIILSYHHARSNIQKKMIALLSLSWQEINAYGETVR